MKRIYAFVALLIFLIAANASAQTAVNIRQVGDSAIGTTIPVAGATTTPPSLGTEPALVIRHSAAITDNVLDPNIVTASVSIAAATTTQEIAISGTKSIYVTSFGVTVGTTAATGQTVQFVAGTGAGCANGQTVLTGALTGATQTSAVGDNTATYLTAGDGTGRLFSAPAGQALCIKTTGTQGVGGWLSAIQFFYEKPDADYGLVMEADWKRPRHRQNIPRLD